MFLSFLFSKQEEKVMNQKKVVKHIDINSLDVNNFQSIDYLIRKHNIQYQNRYRI